MCGRYALMAKMGELVKAFNLENDIPFEGTYNAAPSQSQPIIIRNRIGFAEWGFKLHAEKTDMRPPINTRSETAHQKPMFKDSFFRRRCIIPAQGFYEWPYQKKGANPAYYYLEDDDALMGFAGIWSKIDGEDGKPLVTFSILTKEAIAPFKDTHPRMPVMLTPEQCKIWMFEPAMDARRVLPQHELRMTGHEVSTAVNNPANNNQELIRQLAPATLF